MSDLTRENRARLAALIKQVTRDRVFDDAWHALFHYHDDADIRSRDASYADHLQAGLERWVERLQATRGH